MNLDTIIQLALSSAIFSFPRQFPMELYTRVRRLFKGKRKGPETEFSDPALESTDPEEAQLANHFRKACKAVESSSALSNKHLITFYGLYKQATIGNCNREKPSESSVADFMKWEEWLERLGMSQAEAKREYVRLAEEWIPHFKESLQGTIVHVNEEDELFMTDKEYEDKRNEGKGQNLGMKFSRPAALGEEFVKDGAEHQGDLEVDVQEFFDLIEREEVSELEKLIKAGYDLNKQDASGMKPIHYAIENDKEEVFELLCNHYEDLNIPDESGMTPLHYAVAHENEQIIETLLNKNADVHREDKEGETPMDIASGQVRRFIEQHQSANK